MPRNPDYYQKQSDCSAHTIVTAAENVKLQMLLNRLIDIIAEDPTVEKLLINKVAPVVEEVKTTLTDTVLPTINEQVLPVVEEVKKNIEPLVTEVATEVLPTVQQNLDAESKIREDHDKQLGTAIKNLNRVIGTEHLGEQSIVDIITLLKTKDQELLSAIKNCTTTADQKIIDSVQDARIKDIEDTYLSPVDISNKVNREELEAYRTSIDQDIIDSELESKLGTAISENWTNTVAVVNTETLRAVDAENNIRDALNARVTDAENTHSRISQSLTDEINRATTAETQLQTNIDNAVSAANSADAELRDSIAQLVATDAVHLQKIQEAISDFENYVATDGSVAEGFRSDIDANRVAIKNEISRATTAEQTLDTKIENEIARSKEVDNSLTNEITSLNTRFNAHLTQAEDRINTNAANINIIESKLGAAISENWTNTVEADNSIRAEHRVDVEQLRKELAEAQVLIQKLVAAANTSEIAPNAEITVSEDDLNTIIPYGSTITYDEIAPTAESVAANKLLVGVEAEYTTGSVKGQTVELTRHSLTNGTNGTGAGRFSLQDVRGSLRLSGKWMNKEYIPIWNAGSNGTKPSNVNYNAQVQFGTTTNLIDLPYTIGNNGAQILSGTVYAFDGWDITGNSLTASGIQPYSSTNLIPAAAISATGTAKYKTLSYIRNKATVMQSDQHISTDAANDAAIYKVCNLGNIATGGTLGSPFIKGGPQTTENGVKGIGFVKVDDRGMDEDYYFNGFQIPVALDGSAAVLNKTRSLKAIITAKVAVGVKPVTSTGARASAWVSAISGLGSIGPYFDFTQANDSASGAISTSFSHFNGLTGSQIAQSRGDIPVTTVYGGTQNSWSTNTATVTYECPISIGAGGFKIGVCTGFYNRAPGSKLMNYALLESLSYRIEEV